MKNTLILPVLFGLTACAFNDPAPVITYYLLDPHPAESNMTLDHTRVQVSSVRLPDYLKQPNLVMREDTNELRMANYHSWADNLSDAIQRVVINDANQLNSAYSFVSRCDACPSVTISIEHFYPTRSGQVVLAGTFEIVAAEGQSNATLVRQFSFSHPIEKEGYDNAVEQMRLLLSQLSVEIVNQLSIPLTPTTPQN